MVNNYGIDHNNNNRIVPLPNGVNKIKKKTTVMVIVVVYEVFV